MTHISTSGYLPGQLKAQGSLCRNVPRGVMHNSQKVERTRVHQQTMGKQTTQTDSRLLLSRADVRGSGPAPARMGPEDTAQGDKLGIKGQMLCDPTYMRDLESSES